MLFRLIVAVFVAFVLYRLARWVMTQVNRKNLQPGQAAPSIAKEDLVEDPHCGTYIPLSGAYRETIDGKAVYFCSPKCLDEYRRKRR